MLQNMYSTLYISILVCIGIAMLFSLIRCITGKRIVDRIICINMICNQATFSIAILALYLNESYLLDVCMIYVMLSFLAVLILTKVFISVYLSRKKKKGAVNDDI